jgi:hypothetical protein
VAHPPPACALHGRHSPICKIKPLSRAMCTMARKLARPRVT